MKKFKVIETFEQGFDRKDGGAIKLLARTVVSYQESEHGHVMEIDGKLRTVPIPVFNGWVSAGLIALPEA